MPIICSVEEEEPISTNEEHVKAPTGVEEEEELVNVLEDQAEEKLIVLVTENELEIQCEDKHEENEESEEAITEEDNDNDSSHTIAVYDQIQEVLETTKLVASEDSKQILRVTDTSKPLSPCPAYDTEQETASVAKR